MDYTKYSFEDLTQRATKLVEDAEGWGDAYTSSTGQTLIQLIAALTDQLHYMLERRTQENFLPTARLESSIHALAGALAYRPRRVVSSTGYLEVQPTDNAGAAVQPEGDIVIPSYSAITYGDSSFVNLETVTIPAGATDPVEFEIIEGTVDSITLDPNEVGSTLYDSNYVLIEDYKNIEEFSLRVFTETEEYLDVTKPDGDTAAIGAMSFASPTDLVYDLRITNEGLMVLFGNNKFGKKPTTPVTIQWVTSTGVDVSIVATGLAFSFETSTLEDDVVIIPPNTYRYTLVNTTPIIGGLSFETQEDVKIKTPDYVRSADRAVTAKDFEFWAKRSAIGSIVDVKAYGENELGVNPQTVNHVYLVYLTSTNTTLSTTNQQKLRDYMDNYKTLTTHLVVAQAEETPLQINLSLKRNPMLSMSNSELYDILKREFEEMFSYKEGSLGSTILHSEIVEHFHNLSVVRGGTTIRLSNYVNVDVRALKEFSAGVVTQEATIEVVDSGSDGDDFTIVINGTSFTHTKTTGQTVTDVADALVVLIDGDANYTASNVAGVITITPTDPEATLTINNEGTTVPANMPVLQTIQLPPPYLKNEEAVDFFLPEMVELLDSDYNILFTDDGAGNFAGGTIDYTTGEVVIPVPAAGDYYIRFLQNTSQNLQMNPTIVATYSPPKDDFSTVEEKLSTIEIIT